MCNVNEKKASQTYSRLEYMCKKEEGEEEEGGGGEEE